MNGGQCPVCGYQNPTNGKCNCCGNQYGVDYSSAALAVRAIVLRSAWVDEGCKWHGEKSLKPVDWSPYAQMKKGGLIYPIAPTLNTFYDMQLINNNDLKEWAKSFDKEQPFFSDLSLYTHIKMNSEENSNETIQLTKHLWAIPKRKLNFSEEFALRIHSLDTTNLHETAKFMFWVSKSCHGLNRNLPEVKFAYKLNQNMKDKTDIDPYDYFFNEIDNLKESTSALNNELWDEIKCLS